MASKGQDESDFNSVIMSNFYRISECTSHKMPFDNILDGFWAIMEPFLDEYDHEHWRELDDLTTYSTSEMFQSIVGKLQLISLVLYKNGILPNRDSLKNRKYEKLMEKGEKGSRSFKYHVIEDVKLQHYIMKHLRDLSYIMKNRMEFDVHADVLWAVLSPYVTEEDYLKWKLNNKKFSRSHPYRWNIEKIRICMIVLERADFLLETGMTDEPIEYIDKDGKINVGAE